MCLEAFFLADQSYQTDQGVFKTLKVLSDKDFAERLVGGY
jgi:hypothetical protein